MAKKVVKSGSEMLAEIIIKGIQEKKGKDIVGSVKVFLPVKSIKIGRGGNGLTIVDAKGETYKFA